MEVVKVPFKAVLHMRSTYLNLITCFRAIELRKHWAQMIISSNAVGAQLKDAPNKKEPKRKFEVKYFNLAKGLSESESFTQSVTVDKKTGELLVLESIGKTNMRIFVIEGKKGWEEVEADVGQWFTVSLYGTVRVE